MPIKQIRAFVGVAVAAEHQVHPMTLQNRVGILAHLLEFGLRVGIVRALAVGGMVPVGNEPLLGVGIQIGLQPRQHRPTGRAVTVGGIQADKVDVGIVEGVVGFSARGHAAGLPALGQGEDVIVGATLTRRVGTVGVMV